MIKCVIIFLSFLVLVGCNKPNPTPELMDPIYQDLLKELAAEKKALDDEKKMQEEHEVNLKAVVPQTGQIRFARKRLDDSKNKIDKINQFILFYESKVESRKEYARIEYLKAFTEGRKWPDPAEYKEYQAFKKVQGRGINWNINQRFLDLGYPAPNEKRQKKEEKK